MAEQGKPADKLDETERDKLRRIGDGLRHVHPPTAELTDLPDDIAELMKRLEK